MKKIRAIIFIVLIVIVGTATIVFFPVSEIRKVYVSYGGGLRGLLLTAMDKSTLADQLNNHIVLHDRWIDLYGGMQRVAGVDKINNINRLKDGSVVGEHIEAVPPTTAQQEEFSDLKKAADSVAARSLFVSIPTRYCPEQSEFAARGIRDLSLEDMAYRRQAFEKAGFDVLDLHEKMHEQGLDHPSLYFRTDHHWTGHAGLWAAKEIGDRLGLDTALLDTSLYAVQKHSKIFLGSAGKYCGKWYCAPDDLDILIPSFETNVTLRINGQKPRSGTFEQALLFPEYMDADSYVNYFPYSVFLSGDHDFLSIQNHQRTDGVHILLIKDSFTDCMAPYLAMCAERVDLIDPRFYKDSTFAYIRKEKPDVVCVTATIGMGIDDLHVH